jgi:glycosyltransferase involved in cell wall biosynthesis
MPAETWILQFCHGYSGPFLDVARQYAVLFKGSPCKVLTVFLTGEESAAVVQGAASDEVAFLGLKSSDVRGLKLSAILKLRQIVAGRNFSLIIAHRFKPIYVAALATRLPVIGVHHAFGDYDRLPRRWFARLFRRRLALLAVSDAVRDDIRRRLSEWPADRIETLHNRLDVDAVRAQLLPRAEARKLLGLPQAVPVIGNVGRLHPDKDQKTLVAAFARALPALPAGSLLAIAGSGRLLPELQAQVSELGISASVRFLGQVPGARRMFAAFDLFVLSSDHEPFGMVLLEAMAADVPVMATDCGGAPEIVSDKSMLFGLGDVGGLAGKLRNYFSGATKPEQYTLRARDRLVESFSDTVARQRFFSLPMVISALGLPPLSKGGR